MQFPRLTSMALGVGIIALSAMGTIAWKSSGNLWRAQIQSCPTTVIIVCGGLAQDVQMAGPNCDIIPPCPESCGNGVLDEREQCGEPGLTCAAGQTCDRCVCSTTTGNPSSPDCAQDGQPIYHSAQHGPTTCCSKNAGIKPNSYLAGEICVSTTDGAKGTCIDNWWQTCGDGTCGSGEDLCSCLKDCTPSCGNWVLDPGETCEVGVCCPGPLPQYCNVKTCKCEYPTL
ncbi:MAG: hypothetical protein ABIG34_00165 [Candidatus Peregrinibacteria bacterium]